MLFRRDNLYMTCILTFKELRNLYKALSLQEPQKSIFDENEGNLHFIYRMFTMCTFYNLHFFIIK